jgi:glutamate dehydrogenase
VLWNGGIGTYVRAADETDAQVGDRANDAGPRDRRGAALPGGGARAGNLGLTQRARIAAARAGVALNTDFIDNSAGVDTSDREVNLKVLLSGVPRAERDAVLRAVEDEVAAAVLADNALQARALSVCAAQAPFLLDRHAQLIGDLERTASTATSRAAVGGEVERLRQAGAGLTRPEAAVLLAHSKNLVREELLRSDLPDDPSVAGVLAAYFPRGGARALARPGGRPPAGPGDHRHPAGQRPGQPGGPGLPAAPGGAPRRPDPGRGPRVHVATQVLDLDPVWARVTIDEVPLAVERLALPELQAATERTADRLLRAHPDPAALTAAAPALAAVPPGSTRPRGWPGRAPRATGPRAAGRADRRGRGPELAARVAVLGSQADLVDLAGVARTTGVAVGRVVEADAAVERLLALPRVQAWTAEQAGISHWVVTARAALRDEVDQLRWALVAALLRDADGDADAFAGRHATALARFTAVREEATSARDDVLGRVCVVVAELRRLVRTVG